MAFDFNNLDNNDNNKDLTSAFSIEYIVSSFDKISDFYENFDDINDFKKYIFDYIGNNIDDYKEYIIKMGDLDITMFEEEDCNYDESDIDAHFWLTPDSYNNIAKNPKYSKDPKFLAFCSLFLTEFEILDLIVYGKYDVEVTEADPDVGYYGGAEITNYYCTAVDIYNILDSEIMLSYDVVYPRTYRVFDSNLKRYITKTDTSKAKNLDIGDSFIPWVGKMVEDIELDKFDYGDDYEPDYDRYDDY